MKDLSEWDKKMTEFGKKKGKGGVSQRGEGELDDTESAMHNSQCPKCSFSYSSKGSGGDSKTIDRKKRPGGGSLHTFEFLAVKRQNMKDAT